MIDAKTDTRTYISAMKIISKDALPDTVAETLNRTADAVTRQQERNAKKLFTIRTPFTLKSMFSTRAKPFKALNKAMGKIIARMFSRAGSFSPYLWMHDVDGGFTKQGMGGALPIATLSARTSKNEKKPVRKAFRLKPEDMLFNGAFQDDQFVGSPRGNGRRKGLYRRLRGKLEMLRNLETDKARLKDTNFHDNAVKKYGTPQFIAAQFNKIAQRKIDKAVKHA